MKVTDLDVGSDDTGAIKDVGIGLNYGDNCGLMANLQVKAINVNLKDYAGTTFKLEVVAVTNFGNEIAILTLNNITLP